jgi:hypothetical protein
MVDIDECSSVPEPAPAHPDPASISPDDWRRFESATLSVVHKIQPTVSSENLRAAVIDYVQRLFRFHAGYQVLSLPPLLRAYDCCSLLVFYSLKARALCINNMGETRSFFYQCLLRYEPLHSSDYADGFWVLSMNH